MQRWQAHIHQWVAGSAGLSLPRACSSPAGTLPQWPSLWRGFAARAGHSPTTATEADTLAEDPGGAAARPQAAHASAAAGGPRIGGSPPLRPAGSSSINGTSPGGGSSGTSSGGGNGLGSSSGGGGGSGSSLAQVLARFRGALGATPPVSYIRGMQPPSALSWMRRRGPQVPHTALRRVFRQRQIRLFDGSKVIRVHGSRPLRNGERLLFPTDLAPNWPGDRDGDRGSAGAAYDDQASPRAASHAGAGPGPGSAAAQPAGGARSRPALFARQDEAPEPERRGAAAAPPPPAAGAPPGVLTPERVRRWVLGVHPGLVFINKPAGLRVHGRAAGDHEHGLEDAAASERRRQQRQREGSGLYGGGGGGGPAFPATLDEAMRAGRGLRFGAADAPRLVHRLDAGASGVMAVARDADAAAWLSAAFRSKALQALQEGEAGGAQGEGGKERKARGRGAEEGADVPHDLYVRRTYWAFVAGDLQPRQSGRIRHPVRHEGNFFPAVSSYRVRATGGGVSWVELTPETGRRHQLRVHCAQALGAPIIGDGRYGYRGLPPRAALRSRLPPEWWALLGEAWRRPARGRGRGGRGEEGDDEEEGEDGEGAAPPLLLHSRRLVVSRPGRAPLVGVAPLPRYMRQLIEAAGWPMPAEA